MFFPTTKVFVPCSATMFGDVPSPQTEETPFNPQSPYAVAKASVYHMARFYRNVHGLHVVIGILYNHDSPRRHGSYLLHRICRSAVRGEKVKLFKTSTRVTVGEAEKYMEAVIELMQLKHPEDFIIDNKFDYTIQEICSIAYGIVGLDSRAYLLHNPEPHRPGKPECLIGNTEKMSSKIHHNCNHPITPLLHTLIEKYKKELT
jgi:GDPmannose 4,6-dehydratase